MGRLRHHLKYIERQTRGEMVVIPQADGSVAKFPTSDLEEAFLRNMDRLRDENVEPHPLTLALQNATQCEPWHDTLVDMFEIAGDEPLQDLSEP